MDLKEREKRLMEAHNRLSKQIEKMLDERIKIAGAIAENKYMQQKEAEGETPPDKKE